MDENDDYEYGDETLGTHFNDLDRLGGWGRSDEGDIGEFTSKGGFNPNESKEDRFKRKFQEDRRDLNIQLSDKDMHAIDRLIKLDLRIKFKNPLAFLLGYYVVSKSKNIREDDVNQMYQLCNKFVERNQKDGYARFSSIRKADIIRYARFINSLPK
jgi:hypothetical protein